MIDEKSEYDQTNNVVTVITRVKDMKGVVAVYSSPYDLLIKS